MKRLTLILVFFAFFLANAQEMDTTYVINEHGQTIGIIHEKGTVPVMPQQAVAPQQMQQPVQQYPAQQPYAIQPQYQAPVYDSTAYYQALIDRYMQSGTSLRSTGKAMMIGGGIGAFLGIAFLVVADNECEEDRYGDEVCDNDAENLSDAGAILFLGGAAVFGTGIVLKIVGGSKLRKAIRYNDKLMKHQMRRQFTMNLRVNPLVNPVKQSVGGNLALEF